MKTPSGKDDNPESVNFARVLSDELDQFEEADKDASNSETFQDTVDRALEKNLVGIAFSGGGIRSATFNLGVLQGLAKLKLLSTFHYLSTVSGGGYIGGWLQALLHREPASGGPSSRVEEMEGDALSSVQDKLDPAWASRDKKKEKESRPAEPREIRFLRQYSNYLTPVLGWFGADTWTVVAIYLRNFLLNLALICLAFLSLIFLCHTIGSLEDYISFSFPIEGESQSLTTMETFFVVLFSCVIPGILAIMAIIFGAINFSRRNTPDETHFSISSVGTQILVIIPLFLASLWGGKALFVLGERFYLNFGQENPLSTASTRDYFSPILGFSIVILFVSIAGILVCRHCLRNKKLQPNGIGIRRIICTVLFGATVAFGILLLAAQRSTDNELNIIFFPPLVVFTFVLCSFIKVGALGNRISEGGREWWSRMNAFALIWIVAWILLMGITMKGFEVVEFLRAEFSFGASAIFAWLTTTVSGVFAAKSAASSERKSGIGVRLLATISPYIFIVGLFLGLSWMTGNFLFDEARTSPYPAVQESKKLNEKIQLLKKESEFLHKKSLLDPESENLDVSSELKTKAGLLALESELTSTKLDALLKEFQEDPITRLKSTEIPQPRRFIRSGLLFFLLLFLSIVVSEVLNVNRFSLHRMYKNRLVRGYLGASNNSGNRHPFTGFDEGDDVPLSQLHQSKNSPPSSAREGRTGPYPIFNAALNLVNGKNLAWQKRKAGSFVFTPKYCGFDSSAMGEIESSSEDEKSHPGYFPTGSYATKNEEVTLGTAMAISGAAVSPNMGYHSSPAATFLLTVFNVRLGWWIGNPASPEGADKSGPSTSLLYLLSEMFGFTTASSRFIYLSDGGHFENLGVYELVRRRCKFVLVCDAENDANFEFDALGNAIEKCRTDFGIEIDINVDQIRNRDDEGYSEWHWAVGTIDYGSPEDQGIIVYVKSSLTGDAPEDILRYAEQNPEFPHQSTADQWFDETQFECYRRLGQHIIEKLFENRAEESEKEKEEPGYPAKIFRELKDRWYPPSRATENNFSVHTKSVTEIFNTLRTDPELRFMSYQLYPEWKHLVNAERFSSAAEVQEEEREQEEKTPRSVAEMRSGFYFCNSLIQLMEEVYIDLHFETDFNHPDNRGWMNIFKHWAWSNMLRTTWTISASMYGYRFQQFCERELDLNLGNVTVEAIDFPGEKEETSLGVQLNFHEKEILNYIFSDACKCECDKACKCGAVQKKNCTLYGFGIQPDSGYPENDTTSKLVFTFGFCLMEKTKKGPRICFFRIQDHLRSMGLADRACGKLLEASPFKERIDDLNSSNLISPLAEKMIPKTYASLEGIKKLQLALNSALMAAKSKKKSEQS